MSNLVIKRRGRPAGTNKQTEATVNPFDPTSIQIVTGAELQFDQSIFNPMRTDTIVDDILSTNGGLMPATNMIICGGPGSGKTTMVLDMISRLTRQGYKTLFVSGEMDEIGYYKYCRRMPQIANVPTLFLKNYSTSVREALEHAFKAGYEVIAIDSVAEVIDMYKDAYRTTESAAEMWFLDLQTKNKKGDNDETMYTAFINIQQVTKSGEFSGSNRLKHMTDAMCSIKKDKDGDTRIVQFSKNRDCDTSNSVQFRIGLNQIEYSYPEANDADFEGTQE